MWRRDWFGARTRREVFRAFGEIRRQKYQVAADFQGAIKSAFIATVASASTIFGMANPRERLARVFYHRSAPTAAAHVIEQYHALAEAVVGRDLPRSSARIPQDEESEREISRRTLEWGREFVVVSPGAGWGAKRWPAERYAEVARTIAGDGFLVAVNVGPGEEWLARVIERAAPESVRCFAGSLGELIALTRRARIFIGGDSGPLHLAAALGIPVVAIFGPTDPARNGPYGSNPVVLRNPSSKTSLSHQSRPDPGLLGITSEEVVSAVRQRLSESHV